MFCTCALLAVLKSEDVTVAQRSQQVPAVLRQPTRAHRRSNLSELPHAQSPFTEENKEQGSVSCAACNYIYVACHGDRGTMLKAHGFQGICVPTPNGKRQGSTVVGAHLDGRHKRHLPAVGGVIHAHISLTVAHADEVAA